MEEIFEGVGHERLLEHIARTLGANEAAVFRKSCLNDALPLIPDRGIDIHTLHVNLGVSWQQAMSMYR